MAFFALLWKARTIENYRLKYEKEKNNSIVLGNAQLEQTLSQRWRHYRFDTKKRLSRFFKKWYPDGSVVSNFFLYLMTDQTFPNFLLKSVMGFVGGIILTYLCFMFFVFQLAISLIHATIMSSIIGVLLTLGLAFSYRIRCLVFLLIPQFFSRVGRYTLTCYALVLILTGPATNTLKNSEVLSESMACSQEQIKTSVHQLNDLMKKPINAMKDSLKLMVDQLKTITAKVKETVIRLDRLVLSIVTVIKSSFSWLQSVADICNSKLGTPYDRCCKSIQDGFTNCQKNLGPKMSVICNVANVAQAACLSVKPFKAFCYATDFMDEAISASVKKKLRNFSEHLKAMFHVEVHIHHSYSYSSNTSRSASQVAAGIVTEIRNRADPLLTWLSWSSCVTSLFLLLIIFRAKYYQHMYETRSRFDNRYVTKELQQLDLKRQQQGRETVLPLNRRERAKYIKTSSFRLVASEKVYLNRSAVFMAITTFKLLIHMVADYSLYWVLMTIRCHGRYQSDLMPGIPHSGAHVSGSGFVARLFTAIVGILDIPLTFPASAPISCLPDPYPPDLRRYTQIGVLIFLLWFFALFEPYGLRLRHLIMGQYRPERAKARATWLYNHILRTRGSFMKFARRKLHREYKYPSETSLTFRQWITDHVPFQCLRSLVGLGPAQQHCLLCGITSSNDPDSRLTKCQTPRCPGVFCMSCFSDIGELCTICLSPADYGDMSDVSLEKGSSDDSDSDIGLNEERTNENITLYSITESDRSVKSTRSKADNGRWSFYTETTGPRGPLDTIALLHNECTFFSNFFQNQFRNMKRNMKKRCQVKKRTLNWIAKLTPENMLKDFSKEKSHNYYSNSLNIEEYGLYDEVINRTKSIGTSTDRSRSVLLNMLVNRFTRRRLKQPRNKLKKSMTEIRQNKTLSQQRIRRMKKHTNLSSSRKTFSINTFNTYDLTLCQRNLKSIVRRKKYRYNTKDKIFKVCEELKGIVKAIRFFHKSNAPNKIWNQNNDAPNHFPIENKDKTTKPSDNANFGEKTNKKKCSKANKPKKTKKQKNTKIKTKISRPRISEFHKFLSHHWNNFKCSIIPGYAKNRPDIPISKEKRNHKRRKKRKTDINECFRRTDIKHTRNLRISAFLAELEWTKKDSRKDEDIGEGNDSFFCTHRPITTNKIVGMVHLKNLPFQWREAPKRQIREKKCVCAKKQSVTRLFVTLSKQKLYAKRALDRFRHKDNTVAESSPSSLVQKMMNSLRGAQSENPFSRESSICISKRASVFRSFGLSKPSDILDTDMIFKNGKFGDNLTKDPSRDKPSLPSNLTEKSSNLSSFLRKEIIVSYSSTENPGRCKCDFYDDLQRKWDHVKKSISEFPGPRNPFSILKNFCSSLFGPTCNLDTCPNKLEKRGGGREKRGKRTAKVSDSQESCVSDVSVECQASNVRDEETQLTDEEEVEDTIRNAASAHNWGKRKVNKGIQIHVGPGQGVGPGRCKDPDKCDAAAQYVQESDGDRVTKGVGSHLCLCDEAVQITPQEKCTCATQYGGIKISNLKYRDKPLVIHEVTTVSPVANKKTQHKGAEVADKATHCTARKHYKKGKEVKSGVSKVNQKLSLESNLLVGHGTNVAQALKDELTDCIITDTSISSLSVRSDESKTDTTICSLATFGYVDPPKRRKYRIKVVTKTNQSTLTDTARVCDTGTETHDWWSPMVERKPNDEILLEKKKGLNVKKKETRELRQLKALKELKEATKRRKNFGVATDARNVSFRSSTQIIPSDLFPNKDIMSPSRYLLESQRYYNELFAYNYRPRPQVYNYVTQMPKYFEKEKSRSPIGSRRNHHRKMKRLDECYSPRRQTSPRKRKTESTRTSDSPRRKFSNRHDRQPNTRHHAKSHSPRKQV